MVKVLDSKPYTPQIVPIETNLMYKKQAKTASTPSSQKSIFFCDRGKYKNNTKGKSLRPFWSMLKRQLKKQRLNKKQKKHI